LKINNDTTKRVVIIGAGPAGLTAAYQLCKLGISGIVVEKDDVVGGISRTVSHNGYHFDIGGHRFFTKLKIIDDSSTTRSGRQMRYVDWAR
jgi:protoporphyrinogen oxidase